MASANPGDIGPRPLLRKNYHLAVPTTDYADGYGSSQTSRPFESLMRSGKPWVICFILATSYTDTDVPRAHRT